MSDESDLYLGQLSSSYTGRIRICGIPKGSAPLWIRCAWGGLVLPCHSTLGIPPDGEFSITGEKLQEPPRPGFQVPILPALAIMREVYPQAAASLFWSVPHLDHHFFFGEDEAEILNESVTIGRIIHVPDEAQGQVTR